MTIILFLIDTSSSMNQRTYLGARPTLLDVAKDAVEKFLKARARDIASRGDRYMLLTFEDPPINIKAGWKESHATFMNELKHLTATGVTNMGPALKNAFDLLNLNRMQSGIDTYGVGRAPYYLEPSMIIVITDGSSLTNQNGVQTSLELPMQNNIVPGSELTREPFRWDQRLYSLILRLTGTPPIEPNVNPTLSPDQFSSLTAMCAVTAGRSYTITTQKSIMQSIDALVSKVQSGVVIQFEKVGLDPQPIEGPAGVANNTADESPASSTHQNNNGNTNNSTNNSNSPPSRPDQSSESNQIQSETPASSSTNGTSKLESHSTNQDVVMSNTQPNWHSTRSLIYVHRSLQKPFPVGHWPIPESYWPDPNLNSLPPRTAHPIVKFSCSPTEPHMLDALPFDKYELESSPLTQYILSRKQPQVAWQVFVANSGGRAPTDLGAPFGYLKAATSLNCVNLFVMPYNYTMLLPIMDEILKKPQHTGQPPRQWKHAFDEYLKTMPPYYANPLKRVLTRMGATGNLVPELLENQCLSYAVASKLKSYKSEAKAQFDRLIQAIQQQQNQKNQNLEVVRVLQCGKNLRSQVESTSYTNMSCTGQPVPAFYFRYQAMKSDLNEFPSFALRIRDKANTYSSSENVRTKHTFRNPYDIDRKDLIDQIHLMRANFMQTPSRIKFKDEDQIHTLPIAQMGNYQDYLKKQPAPLREIESTPVRQHMFGNPFKIDKKGMMVDEADSIGAMSDNNSPSQSKKKLNPNQRRRGPLPKDFIMLEQNSWRRSPTASPSTSPVSSPAPNDDAMTESESTPTSSSGSSSGASDGGGVSGGSNSGTSSCSSGSSSPNHAIEQNGNSFSHKSVHELNDNSSISSKQNASNVIKPTEQDLALRSDIFKHIRGPGVDYNTVLKTISKLKGEKRKYILEETIREAKRFKKVRLLHQLNLISRQ